MNKKGTKLCPRDQEPLREIHYESERVDLCPRCKGVWCDGDELKKIIDSREKQFSGEIHKDVIPNESNASVTGKESLIASLKCLACLQPMQAINYAYSSGIHIDRCSRGHGTWLDHGELEKIQVFVERWESEGDRLVMQYGGALKKARQQATRDYAQTTNELKVSRFGIVNRILHAIQRLL
ncbi:MAG: zf-TFIIB domain-containing protein [Bdellovibrionota bacterium]